MSKAQGLIAATATLLFAMTVPAFAHSHPVKMNPAPDSTVTAPSEVSIFFTEELEPKFSFLKLKNSAGKLVTSEHSRLDPANAKHMTLALPHLAPGIYTLEWMASAEDGHRMTRSYKFSVK
jgi:methionine-rich copper-binding protein CopC